MGVRFNSKKSTLFFLLIVLIPTFIGVYLHAKFMNLNFILAFFLVIITFLNLYMFFFTYYIVNNNSLIIKVGMFTYKTINLKDITKVKEDNSITKSLATSTKNRIEIFYKNSSVIVSPKDKIGFLNTMNTSMTKNLTQ